MADKRLTRLMHMEALVLSKDYFAVGQGRILGTLFDQADKCSCIESMHCHDFIIL